MVLFTSGSSGEPTGVCLSLGQLAANAAATVEGWRLTGSDVGAISTPLFHTSGWHSLATPLLSVGGTLVLTRRFDAQQLTPLLAAHRCSVGFLVPTQLTMWSQAASFGLTLPALRWMLVGGAALPQLVARTARGVGYLVRDAYGLTEFGPNCFGWGHDEVTPIEAVGRPLPLLEWRLVAENGEAMVQGPAEGELWLRGPQAPSGILDAGEGPPRRKPEGGWIRTGDLLRCAQDGTFSVIGRLSDRYISGGETIHPVEVESVLGDHVGVAEVAVMPLPDSLWGEVGCAVVRPSAQGAPVSLAELRAHARGRLAGYKLPRALLLVDELPRLGSGKVDRGCLRAQLLERSPERLAG
jgi:fatty-acyl-CoA synthase